MWCGGTVDYIRELYPDVQLEPVRIPVSKGNALAISSFLPHCGPPIPGLRGFILAGPQVFKLSDSQEENWRLLISPGLLLYLIYVYTLQDGSFQVQNNTTEELPSSICFGALMSFLKPLRQQWNNRD